MRRKTMIGALIAAGVVTVCIALYSMYGRNEGARVTKNPSNPSVIAEEVRPSGRGEESDKGKKIRELEEKINELTEQYESRIASLESLLAQEQPSTPDCMENAKIAEEVLSRTGIHGYVYGAERRPAQWIEIRITAEDTKTRQIVTSNKDGYYEIRKLKPGFYYGECELYPGDNVVLEVLLGKLTAQDFGTKTLGRLFGTVFDEKGKPVKVRVQLMSPQYRVFHANSDDYGNYEFTNLPREKYTVSICKGSGLPNIFAKPIQIPENTTEYEHDIHLSGFSLSGRVLDEQTGEPVPGVKIQAHCEIEGNLNIVYALSDRKGYYRFENLPSGKYTFQFWPQNYAFKSVAVPINENTSDCDIELSPVNPLWLLIKDQYGRGIGSHFTYSMNGPAIAMTVGPCAPEKNGFYAIRNLEPGEYRIGVTADGYEPFEGTISVPKEGYPKDEPFQITINRLE